MSKAFTKEDDGGGGGDELPLVEAWPAGVKNYLTPAGLAALKREIERLRAAPRGDAQQKAQLEQRLQALLTRLEAAEPIDPSTQPRDVARFGATVTVEDDEGVARRYRIVGVDEADPRRGWVSWRSPVARALTGRRVGDTTTLHTPAGDEELTIAAIDYGVEE
ncbi:MAG TPA: GreA/GreB family elongation factor [Polyangia bacterium]